MYKIYLRTPDQRVDGETKTTTKDQVAAATAFATLVGRADLDGQRVAAVLSYNARHLAFHRFDRPVGENDNWRGRLHEIEWPDAPVPRGGAREGAGRRAQTSDGGVMTRRNVSLDQQTVAILIALGDGELSEGIRRAARIASRSEG